LNLFETYRWGTAIERERHVRIKLLVFAYAYEVENDPLVTDQVFDTLARSSNTSIETGKYDEWWKNNFNPYTGLWIHKYPEIDAIKRIYDLLQRARDARLLRDHNCYADNTHIQA
jgi:hypothetical protein